MNAETAGVLWPEASEYRSPRQLEAAGRTLRGARGGRGPADPRSWERICLWCCKLSSA